MKHLITSLLALGAGVYSSTAEFGVSLRTTASDTSDSGATRLYNLGAPAGPGTDPSEVSDPMWLVFAVDGDGIITAGALSNPSYDGTANGLRTALIDPDDFVVFTTLNPTGAGAEGRTLQSIVGLPSNLQTGGSGGNDAGGTVKPGFALLFDDSDLTNGGKFGYRQVVYSGMIPQVGNVNARIGQSVYADAHSFTKTGTPPPQPTLAGASVNVSGEGLVYNFTFDSAAGTSNQVQSTPDLTAPIQWANEGAAIPGDGTTKSASVTTPPPVPAQKFFRVIVN